MAEVEFTLTARSPLGGADIAIGENRIVERTDMALVSVACPLGGDDALATRVKDGWGLAMPEARLSRVAGDARALWMAPDQIMLILPDAAPLVSDGVAKRLDGAGYVTEQTDAWAILEIAGPDTMRALERLCPLDLAPDMFPKNASARTRMEHMGAVIVRLDDARWLLMSASSSARSFLHAVETSYRNVVG